MDSVWKCLPMLYGTLLGWFLLNPPSWLDGLGPWAWLVNAAIVALLVVSVVPLIVLANLPERLQLDAAPHVPVPAEIVAIRDRVRALGFRSVGEPFHVKIAPPALLLGFVHESEPIYATLFRTGMLPAKVSYDFVSILHGELGGLTTGIDPEGAALDGGAESLRQVVPGADVEELLDAHRDGMAYLRERGLALRPVSADRFVADLSAGVARQRRSFTRRPVRATLVTFWRAATRRVPFVGLLREQTIAERQIVSIHSGQTRPIDAIS